MKALTLERLLHQEDDSEPSFIPAINPTNSSNPTSLSDLRICNNVVTKCCLLDLGKTTYPAEASIFLISLIQVLQAS